MHFNSFPAHYFLFILVLIVWMCIRHNSNPMDDITFIKQPDGSSRITDIKLSQSFLYSFDAVKLGNAILKDWLDTKPEQYQDVYPTVTVNTPFLSATGSNPTGKKFLADVDTDPKWYTKTYCDSFWTAPLLNPSINIGDSAQITMDAFFGDFPPSRSYIGIFGIKNPDQCKIQWFKKSEWKNDMDRLPEKLKHSKDIQCYTDASDSVSCVWTHEAQSECEHELIQLYTVSVENEKLYCDDNCQNRSKWLGIVYSVYVIVCLLITFFPQRAVIDNHAYQSIV